MKTRETISYDGATPDERAGMDWFNALTDYERGYWLELASQMRGDWASGADAWAMYKRVRAAVGAAKAVAP